MSRFFTDITTTALVRCMDKDALRQKIIANNIANVDTPGFIRSDVSFAIQLKDALSTQKESEAIERVKNLKISIENDLISPMRSDGNNVSIDKEMTELSKNTMEYETLARLLNMKSSLLQTAITEGKK